MTTAHNKPHICVVRNARKHVRWVCNLQFRAGGIRGFGDTPLSAYMDWKDRRKDWSLRKD